MIDFSSQPAVQGYSQILRDILRVQFPLLTLQDVDAAINYSINKRYKEEKCVVDNNYNKRQLNTTLLEICNYIIEREPIITAWGVLWKKKGSCPNPLAHMIEGFMVNRNILKKTMFKFPKGTDEFAKYNLLQLLEKLNANGTLII